MRRAAHRELLLRHAAAAAAAAAATAAKDGERAKRVEHAPARLALLWQREPALCAPTLSLLEPRRQDAFGLEPFSCLVLLAGGGALLGRRGPVGGSFREARRRRVQTVAWMGLAHDAPGYMSGGIGRAAVFLVCVKLAQSKYKQGAAW